MGSYSQVLVKVKFSGIIVNFSRQKESIGGMQSD